MKFLLGLPLRMCNVSVKVSRSICTTPRYNAFKMNDLSFIDDGNKDTEIVKNNMTNLIARTFQNSVMGQQIYIIQPFIRWGPKMKQNTTPELMLDESVSLINTLEEWKVVGKTIISLNSFDRKSFFGSGKLNELKTMVQQNIHITSLFISVEKLSRVQHDSLEEFFGIPVYDRYLIVMQIFREHATSEEAKLQIALAELPYLYSRMSYLRDGSLERIGGAAHRISGTTQFVSPDTRKLILHRYESRLRKKLEKLINQREFHRQQRKSIEHPVVAVVGYTNSGKTSLIKALTGQEKLVPKNCLFATLDVSFHIGRLPCNLEVSFVDTIGFISDIPEYLIEPFKVTLRDAMVADIIIHVQDISHPDWKQQNEKVFQTLDQLEIERKLLGHVINVGNKVDLLTDEENRVIPSDFIRTSCANLQGIDELKDKVEEEIIKATGRMHMVIRAKTGGEEYKWLKSETAVADTIADPKDMNYSLISVILTQSALDNFKRTFIPAKLKK